MLLKHLGIQLEPEELNDLLESLDVEGESDGEIDFEEFYTCTYYVLSLQNIL